MVCVYVLVHLHDTKSVKKLSNITASSNYKNQCTKKLLSTFTHNQSKSCIMRSSSSHGYKQQKFQHQINMTEMEPGRDIMTACLFAQGKKTVCIFIHIS